MEGSTILVVNPRSGGGRTGRRWADMEQVIRRELPELEVRMTEGPGHATTLAREAVTGGAALVVAVGGDGTNNEVVNGFFDEATEPIETDCCFGFISAGTGSDLQRTFDTGVGLREGARAIAQAAARPLDVGRVTFTTHEGSEGKRIFINIASFGISANVVEMVNSRSSGGGLAYAVAAGKAILKFKPIPVTLEIGDQLVEYTDFTLCAVANGKCFGGGMQIAANADPTDGLFDVVHVSGWSTFKFLLNAPKLYSGSHLALPEVEVTRATRVTARARGEEVVLLEVDGEDPGRLPASFELLPGAIQARVGRGR